MESIIKFAKNRIGNGNAAKADLVELEVMVKALVAVEVAKVKEAAKPAPKKKAKKAE